jgi:hypothetical protein
MNGESFGNGTIIITKQGNDKFGSSLWQVVSDICNTNQVKMNAVHTGMVDKGFDFGSSSIHAMKNLKVAMLTGEGVNSYAAGEIWDFFDNTLKYQLTLINASDFDDIVWKEIDVLILPDGKYKFLKDKDKADELHDWIKKGGRLITLESAALQVSKQSWSTIHAKTDSSAKDTSKKNPYKLLKIFENREREEVADNTPGAIYRVDVDNTHPLMFGYPKYYYTLKMDSTIYEFIKKDGWNVGVVKKDNLMAGYVGYKLNPKLIDGLLFGVQDLGKGNITYLADDVMFRNFWENGKLMLCNAVFMVGQ